MRFQYEGQTYGTDAAIEIGGIRYILRRQTAEKLTELGISIVEEAPESYVPPPLTVADFQRAIEGHIETVAHAKSYSSAVSAASYVTSTILTWKNEAETFVAWRDLVWSYAYAELAKVESQQREVPTIEEFINELPVIQWPE